MDRKEMVQLFTQYHLPRWEELPDLELYVDQVIISLEKYLKPLYGADEVILTANMINNYTKQHVTPKPVKKRYGREHMANLIIVTLLKQAFALPDIQQGLAYQKKMMPACEAYNYFCDMQEAALKMVVGGIDEEETNQFFKTIPPGGALTVPFATFTLAAKLVTKCLLKWEDGSELDDEDELLENTTDIKEMFFS